jgi:peptide/nickel transport system permease protein
MITAKYVLERLAHSLLILLVAMIFNFLLPRLVPGNPAVTILLSKYGYLNAKELKVIESQFHLTGSLGQQFESYWISLAHGNLGVSYYFYPLSVSAVIAERLPWTLFLLGTASIISILIGVSLGTYMGMKSGQIQDSFFSTLSISLFSIPYFWLGLIFQAVFAVMITIFPVAQAYSYGLVIGPNIPFIFSVLYHAALPLIVLILTIFPVFALLMRNTMTTTLREDYMTVAVAKGLRSWRLVDRYAKKNSMLPVTTSIALQIGYVVAGAFLIEVVFSYPGIGYTLYQAVYNSDYPLIQGIFLIISASVIFANFFVDILYAYLDPRVVLK